MNHTYRLIWSHRSRCLVVVGEHARRGGKSAGTVLAGAVLAAALLPMAPASAGPTGGVVTQGAGSIARPDASTTAITQTTSRLAIDWTGFSSAAGEKINFIQPDAASIALNRVIGGGRSELMGSLNANGQVFVINPNGVLFGPTAQVNVGGLLASTLDMDSKRFFGGSQILEGGGQGSVVNQGTLTARQGGYIVLAGPGVSNEGAIGALQGKVLMAAGDKVSLTLDNGSLIGYSMDRGSLDALVQNSGSISASGGEVTLTASAAEQLGRAAVNHTGVIEARTLQGRPGAIRLLGDMKAGTLQVAGKLDASAPDGGNGGFVETSAARVQIAGNAQVSTLASTSKTGTWLIDPDDFTVQPGNEGQTTSSIGADLLSSALGANNVSLATSNIATGTGDLYVNAKVQWDSTNKLTLSASRNIYINADITATKGQLQLQYGQGGTVSGSDYFMGSGAKIYLPDGDNFWLSSAKGVAPLPYRVISKLGAPQSTSGNDLQGISNNVNGGRYVLGADIDAGPTYRWNGNAGFVPISGYTGTLDGLGHKISNLFISTGERTNIGLIGELTSKNGGVRNLYLENATLLSSDLVSNAAIGAVVGKNEGTLFNVHASATVLASIGTAGGLVGRNMESGNIENSSATGKVGARFDNNGLVGVGGLVGTNSGTIANSYSMTTVEGMTSTGGLVGLMDGGTLSRSYAGIHPFTGNGSVTGKKNTGGLIGYLKAGDVQDSYAVVAVQGDDAAGGLIGQLDSTAKLLNTYAAGLVKSTSTAVGGLIGNGSADNVTNSYWNTETTGQASSKGGVGKTGAEMKSLATFKNATSNWNIDDEGGTGSVWRIYDGQTAPLLRSFLTLKEVDAKTVTYDTRTQTGCTGTPCGNAPGDLPFTAASGVNAGVYAPYSTQQGYDIKGGKLTIERAMLTPTAAAPTKIYDGTVDLQKQTLSVTALGNDVVSANYTSAQYDDKNVGDKNKTVTFSGVTLGGAGAGNYQVADTFRLTNASITKRELSVSGTQIADKIYDGGMQAAWTNRGVLNNVVTGDDVKLEVGGAAFADKNVGNNKDVTLNNVSLSGTAAGNYSIAGTATTKGNITPLALSLTGTTIANKTYDGKADATISDIGTLNKVVQGDKVKVSANALFADANAGENKAVTLSGLVLSGDDARNYTVSQTSSLSANIARRALSLIDTRVGSREYDGTTNATLIDLGALKNKVGDDVVKANAAGVAFTNKNVGDNKQVAVTGLALSGKDAGNYSIEQSATIDTSARITPLTLSLLNMKAADKVYDGTAAATLGDIGVLDKKASGDNVTVSARSVAFADKNAGIGKKVTVSGISLSGIDAGNYRIADTANTMATITPFRLTLSDMQIADKVYDGATAASLINPGRLANPIGNDDVRLNAANASAAFADKNAGVGKTVTVSNLALAGADAANYAVDSKQLATATIQPRPLAFRAQGMDKTYDGNANAAVSLNDDRVAGDALNLGYAQARFADGTAGGNKPISVTGIAASGADAGNYVFDASATATGNIARAPLTITANPDSKTFDGTPYRGGNGIIYAGFVAGENASVLGGQPTYGGNAQGAVDVGDYRIQPAGYASQNYAIAYVDGKLTIQPAPSEPVYEKTGAETAAITAAISGISSRPDGMRLLLQQATLQVDECGIRAPQRIIPAGDCASGSAQGRRMGR